MEEEEEKEVSTTYLTTVPTDVHYQEPLFIQLSRSIPEGGK